MRRFRLLYIAGAVVMGIAGYLLTARTGLHAQQGGAQVAIGANDIGGSVSSSKGPEAGVWVIAETTDLPTRYIKEVVTDDQGRYLIPDLPKANYTVWARGYGLVDSPKAQAAPGKHVDLQAYRGAGRKGRRALLSGQLLVCNAERTRQRRISRDRSRGKRPSRQHQEPGPVFGHGSRPTVAKRAINWATNIRARFRPCSKTWIQLRHGCAACSRDKPADKWRVR